MGAPLEYAAEREAWNVYRLEDGTTLRLKLVLTRVERNGSNPNGTPLYTCEHSIVAQIEVEQPVTKEKSRG